VGGRWRAGGRPRPVSPGEALTLLLGHDLPAAQTARDFLAQFHAEDLPLLQEGRANVPAEISAAAVGARSALDPRSIDRKRD
jgi:hypothetical protein